MQCTSALAHAPHKHLVVCAPGELTHDASFSLYKDILLLAGREAGPERWLLFTEPEGSTAGLPQVPPSCMGGKVGRERVQHGNVDS